MKGINKELCYDYQWDDYPERLKDKNINNYMSL